MTYSIIIPTYNSEKTIKRCLDSIIEQTFSNWEVLVMDGVSTDDTISIAESYLDKRKDRFFNIIIKLSNDV